MNINQCKEPNGSEEFSAPFLIEMDAHTKGVFKEEYEKVKSVLSGIEQAPGYPLGFGIITPADILEIFESLEYFKISQKEAGKESSVVSAASSNSEKLARKGQEKKNMDDYYVKTDTEIYVQLLWSSNPPFDQNAANVIGIYSYTKDGAEWEGGELDIFDDTKELSDFVDDCLRLAGIKYSSYEEISEEEFEAIAEGRDR